MNFQSELFNSEDRTEEFKKQNELFRIEAVIHDGNWYTIEKWAKTAKVKSEKVKEYINSKIIKLYTLGNSYRTDYNTIINWYEKQKIPLTTRLVPKNFPPKLWGGKTETEWLLDAKRKQCSYVLITDDSKKYYQRLIETMRGYGHITKGYHDKIYIYCLSPALIKKRVYQNFTDEEIAEMKIRERAGVYVRELTDFPNEFLEPYFNFYTKYAQVLLKNHRQTLKTFLSDESEIQTQIFEWLIAALRKYDETKPVPFSGYLATVLNKWPYDLPDIELGRTLSSFQRKKAKLIAKLEQKEIRYSPEEMAKALNYNLEEYLMLTEETENWLALKNRDDISWEEKGDEKKATILGSDPQVEEDPKKSYNICLAILKTGETLQMQTLSLQILKELSQNEMNVEFLANIDNKFKEELWKNILQFKQEKEVGEDE